MSIQQPEQQNDPGSDPVGDAGTSVSAPTPAPAPTISPSSSSGSSSDALITLAGQVGGLQQQMAQQDRTNQSIMNAIQKMSQQQGQQGGAQTGAAEEQMARSSRTEPRTSSAPQEQGGVQTDPAAEAEKVAKELTNAGFMTSTEEYKKVYDQQKEKRKGILEKIWKNIKSGRVGKAAAVLGAVHAVASIYSGYGVAESIVKIPEAIGNLFSFPLEGAKFLKDKLGIGKGGNTVSTTSLSTPAVGFFDIPGKVTEGKVLGYGDRGLVREVSGDNLKGPFYKFFDGIIGNKAAKTLTKIIGTPFISIFGRGALAKGAIMAGVPFWGQTIFPVIGMSVAAWAGMKVGKRLNNIYKKMTKLDQIKSSERTLLQARREELIEEGKQEEANRIQYQIETQDQRQIAIREEMQREAEWEKRQKRHQENLAL